MRKPRMPGVLGAVLLSSALVAGAVLAGDAVDINKADAATLAAAINGVGMKRAEAIIAYRDAHGPFKSVDDLVRVQGIGPNILKRSREKLTTGAR